MSTIRERYREPLSLDELAETVMVSKFHFLRTFRRVTGVTPGRFISAVRLEEAKRLLFTTSFNVSDIAAHVGYSSTGSFTRRFTESVGCSPTQYRDLRRGGLGSGDEAVEGEAIPGTTGSISGTIHATDQSVQAVYVGVFDSPILERCPATRAIVTQPGSYRMTRVPSGVWYIHAVAHGAYPDDASCSSPRPLLLDTVGPVEIAPGTQLDLDLNLRPLDWARPPILLALPDLDAPVAAA
ncbi:helix-turn-helix transcriptional regulator [Peterkaempfera bronchialis]|uniref:helix-turn-helix transcriptional regulator n=1 Tax=Peterkaempfera bronchialis TaxID=2126346 RepID=UPI003C2E2C60